MYKIKFVVVKKFGGEMSVRIFVEVLDGMKYIVNRFNEMSEGLLIEIFDFVDGLFDLVILFIFFWVCWFWFIFGFKKICVFDFNNCIIE